MSVTHPLNLSDDAPLEEVITTLASYLDAGHGSLMIFRGAPWLVLNQTQMAPITALVRWTRGSVTTIQQKGMTTHQLMLTNTRAAVVLHGLRPHVQRKRERVDELLNAWSAKAAATDARGVTRMRGTIAQMVALGWPPLEHDRLSNP